MKLELKVIAIGSDNVLAPVEVAPAFAMVHWPLVAVPPTPGVTDPAARTVAYHYSAAGDLDQVTDPLGGATRYGYDGAHREETNGARGGNANLSPRFDRDDGNSKDNPATPIDNWYDAMAFSGHTIFNHRPSQA